jgi:hypothetical protein
MPETKRYHVKVFLGTGVIEHYYPAFDEGTISYSKFRVGYKPEDGDFHKEGFVFPRDDGSVDFFATEMVKGICIAPFKGFFLNLDGCEIFCESPDDAHIIAALDAEQARLTKKLQAVKDYLKCKPSS